MTRPWPNTEAKLRGLFHKLACHGTVLVVVDQPASIGALPVAVARACGYQVAYLLVTDLPDRVLHTVTIDSLCVLGNLVPPRVVTRREALSAQP